jgi:hypothetical protein
VSCVVVPEDDVELDVPVDAEDDALADGLAVAA